MCIYVKVSLKFGAGTNVYAYECKQRPPGEPGSMFSAPIALRRFCQTNYLYSCIINAHTAIS